MVFEDFKTKKSVVVVYSGEGKGKTSAGLGLMARAMGSGWNVAFIQFIKYWGTGEEAFIKTIQTQYKDKLYYYKGGKGFYKAEKLSAKDISDAQHKRAARQTYNEALQKATSGKFQLVICDEINNAVHDGLISQKLLQDLIKNRSAKTSLCLTGRNFPKSLLPLVDIATDMKKVKHHYDDKFLANKGIDY